MVVCGSSTGVAPDDIILDGDNFVTPDTSHGPEELVPGQLLDTLDITVIDKVADGGSAIAVRNYTASATQNKVFDLSLLPHNIESLIVKVDNIILGPNEENELPYEINFTSKTITFTEALNST